MTTPVELSPEERVERVRMALAEDGFPLAEVYWCANEGEPWPGAVSVNVGRPGDPTEAALWRALQLCEPDGMHVCWPCWSEGGDADTCAHDPATSPWPEVVR